MRMPALFKKPSAWVPLLLPALILLMLVITFETSGLMRQADEGTEAHLFQTWLVVEAVLIGYFAIKWLPRMPKEALLILLLQIIASLAACFPVFYFNL
jgi:hypothetical protein